MYLFAGSYRGRKKSRAQKWLNLPYLLTQGYELKTSPFPCLFLEPTSQKWSDIDNLGVFAADS